MSDAPNPLRFRLHIPMTVLCSGPGCTSSFTETLTPCVVETIGAPPTLDRAGIIAPVGWKIGAIRVRTGVLLSPGSMPADVPPFPVAFCPTCAEARR